MNEEITVNEFMKENGEYILADIRDASAFAYGSIPQSVNIPLAELEKHKFPADMPIFVYCRTGEASLDAARKLRERGYFARSLKGGYAEWLKHNISMRKSSEIAQAVEDSIRKTMRKDLLSPFIKAIKTYGLLSDGDRIAVCVSGGKDSFLMAKLFQEYKKYSKIDFSIEFMSMDPGYSRENREIIERNAEMLNIPLTVFETDIFKNVFHIEKSPCYICARMRRGHLYSKARELGCNKIALGHHYDDVIETILMGMLYGGQIQTMMPKLKSTNFAGMELIRPMYFLREDDIKAWRDRNGLNFLRCACLFTENCAECNPAEGGSKRLKVKELIRTIKRDDPEIEQNIFKSVENVSLSTLIAYKDKLGNKHYFTEEY